MHINSGFAGLMGGGSPPPKIEYKHSQLFSGGGGWYTFTASNVPIGDESPDRLVVICLSGWRNTGGLLNSVTINGIAATIQSTSVVNGSIATAYAVVPTGTTANITMTWKYDQAAMAMDVFTINNLKSPVPVLFNDNSSLTSTISYNSNTAIISHTINKGSGTWTWGGTAGIVEVTDYTYGGTLNRSSAKMVSADSGVNKTIIATPTSQSLPYLHTIGWE